MSLIRIQNGELAFGHTPLLDHAELIVETGERVCLVGRNGAGKSSLLSVLAGELALDGGTLVRREGVTVAKLDQEVPDSADRPLFEIVAAGLGDHSNLLGRYHEASHVLAERGNQATRAELETLGRLQTELERAGAWESSQRVDAVLSRLALPPDALMSECSGGIRRRAMLGRALVSQPDVLLLDEPTNHLDIESIEALESAIADYPGTVVFVTHDRTFIDHLATRIVELDRGVLTSFPGSYAAYQQRKAAMLDAEADANRKFEQRLDQEEVWIRQGIKARRTRNEGRVRRLEAMRKERAARLDRAGRVNMAVSSGERSGKLVVEAEHVSFGFADRPIIRDFSTLVLRGDRIGIIGRNGTGKSTLLRLLLGELEPDSGTIRRGSRLQAAYFDQERAALDLDASVRDNLAEGRDHVEINGRQRHVISYLGDFLFPPARVNSPVRSLSGGERNRLLLARLFTRPANLLVLDEPTNDLDVETLELLEELLGEFDGTLLLVSHDRSFLDRTVTSTLVLSGDGTVDEHVGGYSDWLEYQARADAVQNRTAAAKPPNPAAPAPAPAAASPADRTAGRPRKLSYREQRELDALPELIESLERELEAQRELTSDPGFYKQTRDTIATAMGELERLETELARAYGRWEEIEGSLG